MHQPIINFSIAANVLMYKTFFNIDQTQEVVENYFTSKFAEFYGICLKELPDFLLIFLKKKFVWA